MGFKKGIRNLDSDESQAVVYEHGGFDIAEKDHQNVASLTYKEFHPGVGAAVDNKHYFGATTDFPHWIAIQNIGSHDDGTPALDEEAEIQAESYVGDDLSTTGTYTPTGVPLDISLSYGDIIYGVFTRVSLRRSDSSGHMNRLRLIRGV